VIERRRLVRRLGLVLLRRHYYVQPDGKQELIGSWFSFSMSIGNRPAASSGSDRL